MAYFFLSVPSPCCSWAHERGPLLFFPTLGKGIRLDLPVLFWPKYRVLSRAADPAGSTDLPTLGKGIRLEEAERARFRGSAGEPSAGKTSPQSLSWAWSPCTNRRFQANGVLTID